MNKVILIGRMTSDPQITYNGELCIARYTLAVDRQFKKDTEQGADFIRCVAFGKTAEWCEKYTEKGLKLAVEGRIQTGSYEDKDGKTVYTTDVIINSQEFVESKKVQGQPQAEPKAESEIFHIPEGADESGLPFNV